MKKMKIILLSCLLFTYGAHNAAYAVSASDIVNYLVDKASSFTSKAKWQDALCKKGDLFGLKYSLRSANGVACKERNVAALALALCNGYADFNDSQCAKNAVAIFGKDPDLSVVLKDVVKNDAKKVGKLSCMAAVFVPTIGGFIAVACKVAGL